MFVRRVESVDGAEAQARRALRRLADRDAAREPAAGGSGPVRAGRCRSTGERSGRRRGPTCAGDDIAVESRRPTPTSDTDDHGGTDTFFAWFFRGEGPKGVVSGANIQRRFIQAGTTYSTFFEDNYVAGSARAAPGGVADALARDAED